MKRVITLCACVIITIIAFLCLTVFQDPIGRYTLILTESNYSGKHDKDHALLLDTKTGMMWTYRSKSGYESKKWHKEEFGD